MVYGEWIDEVDHIEGTRNDNRLAKLRDGSNGQNRKNIKLPRNNTSGAIGVSWVKNINKWRAYINFDGKRIGLGCFDDINDAVFARKSAEAEYGYHPNHGRQLKPF